MSHTRKLTGDPIPLPPGRTHTTLLIASDDRHMTAELQQRLQAGGYTVLVANSGVQALAILHKYDPHLLLVDAELHDLDSSHLCQLIKSDSALGFVPILLIVDADDTRARVTAAQYADASIRYPIDSGELFAWLSFALHTKWHIDDLISENQELSSAARATDLLRSDIISTVAHELSTPLLQVKSAVALLAEDLNESHFPEQVRIADMATQAVARLESVVNNIRQLAQSHQISLGPVVVTEAIDMAMRFMKRSWSSRDAGDRVEEHIEANLPLALGDKRAIARLLQLLLDNALKFSPDDAPVYILAYRLESDRVWIGVQDFGIGIPPEEHKRIFEAFYQVDASTTRTHGGTGTGLALAMLLANGMNTEIEVESQPNAGSTFCFVLPVTDLNDLPASY